MARHGAEALANAELLAVLLDSGSRRTPVLELAHRLLCLGSPGRAASDEESPSPGESVTETGTAAPAPGGGATDGLRYLARSSLAELCRVPGIGPAKAARIKAAVEIGRRLSRPGVTHPAVRSPADVAGLVMEELRHLEHERFEIILLSTRNRVLGRHIISVGGLNGSVVHPRDIFKEAVRRCAAAVILVHNHPSGDPSPSAEDVDITRRLRQAGELLGIEVLDHIIVGDGGYRSLRQEGL